jgi:glycosyltransferase involved in cell wall biosynthesis
MGAALSDEYGMQSSTIRIIPNGSRAASAEPVATTGKTSHVLAAGRMWDDAKNVKALCAIAHSIDWPILVAGDVEAPNDPTCEVSGVHLLGRLSAAAIRHRYRRASIYALPARYEPFGLSVLEAAAAGCALVLGDIPSLRENWCGAAAFVAPDDHAALASTLRRLIADRDARIDLGRRAAARAQMFSAARMATAYSQLYRSLLT